MRTLNRNKTKIYYANLDREVELVDDYGDPTGEFVPGYGEANSLKCNVSASRGTADSELFGINLDYSRTLCIEGTNCPITEESVLWVGIEPYDNVKHNYVVKAIAVSLNNTVIAIKEVTVS